MIKVLENYFTFCMEFSSNNEAKKQASLWLEPLLTDLRVFFLHSPADRAVIMYRCVVHALTAITTTATVATTTTTLTTTTNTTTTNTTTNPTLVTTTNAKNGQSLWYSFLPLFAALFARLVAERPSTVPTSVLGEMVVTMLTFTFTNENTLPALSIVRLLLQCVPPSSPPSAITIDVYTALVREVQRAPAIFKILIDSLDFEQKSLLQTGMKLAIDAQTAAQQARQASQSTQRFAIDMSKYAS